MLTMTIKVGRCLTAAMTSGTPPFVHRMVRPWISRHAFETERISSPAHR
ncbi:hypothetical protein [Bradyrhizobium sp. LMTR 3]|nr:hypothetical protein [Bradyrhizobium sp. LMTR 3]